MDENVILREYQKECLNSVSTDFQNGINRQLIILPTGSGKTIVMAAIARHFNKRTLLLAHREELITQAVEKFKLFWPDVDIGICRAEQDDLDRQIVIGSVQSCSRPKRLERLKEQGFELLMIDEAHHCPSESYQAVIKTLGFTDDSKLLVGVTATPQRSDKLVLGDTFTQVTFSRSISTLIKAGYLSPIVGRKILTNFSLGKIGSSNGDFDTGALAEAINTDERNKFIAAKYVEHAKARKGLAFCSDVKHCQDLSHAFKASGIQSALVWGDMDGLERKAQLEAFKQGKVQVLTSCGILCEGYDNPSVNAIVMARPTKSVGLFTQCIGRGLRLYPGKDNCIVLDFTDKHHSLDGLMSLSNAMPEAILVEDKEEIEEVEREEIDRSPKITVLEECDRPFDILGATRFIWVQIDDDWSLQDDEKNEIVMRPFGGGYVADLYMYGKESVKQIVKASLPLEYCSGVCEDYARRHLKVSFANLASEWMQSNIEPTQSQIDYLKRNGAYVEGMTKPQAAIAIRKVVARKNKQRRATANEPATHKQVYFLKGCGAYAANMTFIQAMHAIAKIKNEKVKYG